jgi:glycosyltransferase involved in cell wall biosynthesis
MISAIILTKNEEKQILDCLNTLEFVDEVIVVDDNSIDKTTSIAQKWGAKVFTRSMNQDYSAQSNFGAHKAKNNWVLFIDADERVSKDLQQEILQTLKSSQNISGYYLKRKDFIWGKWLTHGEVGTFKSLRLFQKNKGKWIRRVHPHVDIKGAIGHLKNPILHYPHQNLHKFINSIDRWSTWHAKANNEEGKIATLFKITFYPIGHFVKNYIFRLGFLDGMQGFVFACLMSAHSYLAWSKLWISQRNSIQN